MRRFACSLLAACAVLAASPAAAQVAGRYDLVSINGHPLPTANPVQTQTTIVRASYWFEEDGRANLAMTANTPSGSHTPRVRGTYVTARDSLHVLGESGRDTLARLRWERQGDTLRLYDRHQNVFRLVRNAATSDAPWTPGTWAVVQVNGHDLPTPWPLDPEFMVTELTFAFDAEGRLVRNMAWIARGERKTDRNAVPYRIVGDKIALVDPDGTVWQEYVWTLREGRLRLMDEYGQVYTLVPAAATAP